MGLARALPMKRNSIRTQQRYGIHEKTVCGTDEYEKDAHQEKEQRREDSLIFCESLDMINLPLSEIFICHNTTIVLIIVSEGRMKVNL